MKRAKEVVPNDSAELRFNPVLKEITGKVLSSETKETGYGSCLILRLEGVNEEVWWQSQNKMPAPILAGQTIRGFYKSVTNGGTVIALDAYEMLDNGRVLTRAARSNYKFVER